MTGICVTYWLCVVSLYRRPEHKEKKSVRLVVTSVSIALQATALVDYGEGGFVWNLPFHLSLCFF